MRAVRESRDRESAEPDARLQDDIRAARERAEKVAHICEIHIMDENSWTAQKVPVILKINEFWRDATSVRMRHGERDLTTDARVRLHLASSLHEKACFRL